MILMLVPLVSLSNQALAWIAVAAAVVVLVKDALGVALNWRKEKTAVDEALAKSPVVREQLELGNVGEAVKHLNRIMEGQAGYITRLENRESALEAEAAGWQKVAEAAERRAVAAEQRAKEAEARAQRSETLTARLSERCDRLEAEVRALRG